MKTIKFFLALITAAMLTSSTCCYEPDYTMSGVNITYPGISKIDTVKIYITEKGNLNNIQDSTTNYYFYTNNIFIEFYEYLNNDLIINVDNIYIDTITNINITTESSNCGSRDVAYYNFNNRYTNATMIKVIQKDY
jgi:hypothetical protein